MKTAQFATAIVVLHLLTHGLHGLAHQEIPIPLSSWQIGFIEIGIVLAPVLAAILLWTTFARVGGWLLFIAMAAAIAFGIYNHLIVISPDHVSQVALTAWGWLFQVTAFLTLMVDALGCWISLKALKKPQPLEQVLQ